MAEKQLRKHVAERLKGHTSQVESGMTSIGIPDTNNHYNGVETWLELKWTTGNKKHTVRGSQMSWVRRRLRAGASNIWILWRWESDAGMRHGIIHLTEKRAEAVFSDTSPSFWAYASARTWGPVIDADELNTVIRRGIPV